MKKNDEHARPEGEYDVTVAQPDSVLTPPGASAARGGQPPAKRYKQFLLTLSVIYPLTMLVPAVLHRLLASVPVLSDYWLAHLLAAATIVGLMVYLVMPRYTRLMARWLYR